MSGRRAARKGRALLAAGLCLLSASPALAGFASIDAGTSGAQFLKLGAGARAEGMGEAYTAVVDGADAIYWNPAALGRIDGHDATFMHSALPADINYDFLGYGQTVGRWAALGVGLQYVSQPSIDQTDSSGAPTGGTFRPSDAAASIGASYELHSEDLGVFNGARLGVTGKYVSSTITKTASTYAADIGFVTAPFQVLDRDFRLAYVASNLGGSLKYQALSDPLPTVLRFGASWRIEKNWLIATDIDEPLDNQPYVSLGTEYRLVVDGRTSFAGRLGFNSRAFGEAGNFSGVTLGLGAKFERWGLDYAFAPQGALGMTQYVSLGFKF